MHKLHEEGGEAWGRWSYRIIVFEYNNNEHLLIIEYEAKKGVSNSIKYN